MVAILPGSRMSELKYNARVFVEAAVQLAKRDRLMRFIVPMAGPAQRAYFEQLIGPAKLASLPLTIINGKSHAAIEASDAVLVASGTATLEVALYKKPMVISYRMNPASWQILRFMAYQPWVGLPNVMAREFLVPELLQDRATPQALASAFMRLIRAVAEGASSRSASENPSEAGVTERLASSEKRSMTPKTFDKDVPPLKTTLVAISGVA